MTDTQPHSDPSSTRRARPIVQRVVLAAKGGLIGTADIIPGVSGGTMALVLGIYTRLIDAIRSLNLRWLPPFAGWAASGFRNRDRRAAFIEQWRTMDLVWLINLFVGIAGAIAIAGFILPRLLETYPEVMRGLFFGLVAASVAVPLRLVTKHDWLRGVILVVAAVATFVGLTAHYQPATTPFDVVAPDDGDPVTLETIARTGPSTMTPRELLGSLSPTDQARIAGFNPDAHLASATAHGSGHASPHNDLLVPPGMTIAVPRPAYWFTFVCGVIAICAMILPGVSGSFILLMLGMYYFMVSALKGFLKTLLALQFPATQVGYVALFILGAAIGLVLFSRVLSWLLHHHRSTTMAALAGLMLGSLGVLWPFKTPGIAGTMPVNAWPADVSSAWLPIAMMLIGAALVTGLAWLSGRVSLPDADDAALAHDDNNGS